MGHHDSEIMDMCASIETTLELWSSRRNQLPRSLRPRTCGPEFRLLQRARLAFCRQTLGPCAHHFTCGHPNETLMSAIQRSCRMVRSYPLQVSRHLASV